MSDQETTINVDPQQHQSKDDMDNAEEPPVTTSPSEQPQLPATKGESRVSLVYRHLAAMVRFCTSMYSCMDDRTFRPTTSRPCLQYSLSAEVFD